MLFIFGTTELLIPTITGISSPYTSFYPRDAMLAGAVFATATCLLSVTRRYCA